MIRAVAIDLDQTLLTSDLIISFKDKSAIKKAYEQGICIIIATGRIPLTATQCLDGIRDYVAYCVCYDGALVTDTRLLSSFCSKEIPYPSFMRIFNHFDHKLFNFVIFSHYCVYATNNINDSVVNYYRRRSGIDFKLLDHYAELCKLPIHKFFVYSLAVNGNYRPHYGAADEESVFREVCKIIPNYLNARKTSFGYVECMRKDTSKWLAITEILNSVNVSSNEIMAIGDNFNDIEMIKEAKIGVAVDNAIDEIKSIADIIVNSNNESGVSQAISLLF